MENLNHVVVMPASVRYDNRLKPSAKILYCEIESLINDKGCCCKDNRFFADIYGLTKETVSRLISQLKDHGYIEVNYIYKENSKEIDCREIYPIY
jgi:DNA-binding transcriptional ArsR family regulator